MTVSDPIQQRKERLVRNGLLPQGNDFFRFLCRSASIRPTGGRVEQRASWGRLQRKEVEAIEGKQPASCIPSCIPNPFFYFKILIFIANYGLPRKFEKGPA